MDNSCKRRAEYLRRSLVIVYTERGQWQASFIREKSACLAEVSVTEQTIIIFFFKLTAHEHRAWLLFYSIPVLLGILNLEYIRHLALLVEALWLLLQTSICQEDLICADKLLLQFCKQFSSLYGMRFQNIPFTFSNGKVLCAHKGPRCFTLSVK